MGQHAPEQGLEPAHEPESMLRLWWRYIWPFLYFRDCTRGSWSSASRWYYY